MQISFRAIVLLFVILNVLANGLAKAETEVPDASTLIIGSQLNPSSIDPHFHASGENNSLLPHIYDSLVRLDKQFDAVPALAIDWRRLSDTLWEFDLRQGVRFHDGSALTSSDIAYTFRRIPQVKNSPGSFEIYTKRISRIELIDDYRFRIHTIEPHPYLLDDLSTVMILPHHLGLDVETVDFNSGIAAIGTGPYKLVKWMPGQGMVLERNDDYWGPLQPWKQVQLKQITNAPTRVAALLSGTVDMIDQVPLADRKRLHGNEDIKLVEHEASRLMFIALDSARRVSPYVRDNNGVVHKNNPLQNPDVRFALSLALDRRAIIKYLLDGAGKPAGQLLPALFSEGAETLPPDDYDPELARTLLIKAGLEDGFQITLHSPSDRYPNDAKVAQAIAQMWWKIGIRTKVATQTKNVFFPAAARQEFSSYFAGWATTYTTESMIGLIHSYSAKDGFGQGNRARYSNPEVDRLIELALFEMDRHKRIEVTVLAQKIAFQQDHGMLPLYFPTYAWAYRLDRLHYQANAEGYTQAMRATPVTKNTAVSDAQAGEAVL